MGTVGAGSGYRGDSGEGRQAINRQPTVKHTAHFGPSKAMLIPTAFGAEAVPVDARCDSPLVGGSDSPVVREGAGSARLEL